MAETVNRKETSKGCESEENEIVICQDARKSFGYSPNNKQQQLQQQNSSDPKNSIRCQKAKLLQSDTEFPKSYSTAAAVAIKAAVEPTGAFKREIKLLKNREAARQCRLKKKEYLKSLEDRIVELESENVMMRKSLLAKVDSPQAGEAQANNSSNGPISAKEDHLLVLKCDDGEVSPNAS